MLWLWPKLNIAISLCCVFGLSRSPSYTTLTKLSALLCVSYGGISSALFMPNCFGGLILNLVAFRPAAYVLILSLQLALGLCFGLSFDIISTFFTKVLYDKTVNCLSISSKISTFWV